MLQVYERKFPLEKRLDQWLLEQQDCILVIQQLPPLLNH